MGVILIGKVLLVLGILVIGDELHFKLVIQCLLGLQGASRFLLYRQPLFKYRGYHHEKKIRTVSSLDTSSI